jgi:hypothetical protein
VSVSAIVSLRDDEWLYRQILHRCPHAVAVPLVPGVNAVDSIHMVMVMLSVREAFRKKDIGYQTVRRS